MPIVKMTIGFFFPSPDADVDADAEVDGSDDMASVGEGCVAL